MPRIYNKNRYIAITDGNKEAIKHVRAIKKLLASRMFNVVVTRCIAMRITGINLSYLFNDICGKDVIIFAKVVNDVDDKLIKTAVISHDKISLNIISDYIKSIS
jgi:hypothetical protein